MLRHHRHTVLLILALPLLGLGCRGSQGQPIFEDTFDSPDGIWGDDVRDEFRRGYSGGEYFVELAEPNWFAWTAEGKTLVDARFEIDTRLTSGSEDNHSGIICRSRDPGTFYYLAVSSDGYYGIFRRLDDGPLEAINRAHAMVHSPAIVKRPGVNRLQAVCDGDTLSLFVNGELLETVVDGTLRKGRYGFGAGSGSEGAVRIHFDSLVVYAP